MATLTGTPGTYTPWRPQSGAPASSTEPATESVSTVRTGE
jgi:hypothetical protein